MIDAYNTNTLTEAATIDSSAGFSWTGNGAFVNGRLKVSSDGALLFATVPNGVNIYTVGTPSPAEDWYQFTLAGNDTATLALDTSGATGVGLDLYDSGGNLLAQEPTTPK
jgi:hypothetical protein